MSAQETASLMPNGERVESTARPAIPLAVPRTPCSGRNPFELLSVREREIARLVAAGRSNKEIARSLSISPCTVSSHLRQIFAKLGFTRRIEVCLLWHRAQELNGG